MDNLLRSDVNYIICENYDEIFFDVFDIKFKDSDSLCLESVSKFQGKPVVMYNNFPMVLVKGDKNTQGIYLNEQYTVIPPNILTEDFLSLLGVSIGNVPDELWLCCSPLTTAVTTYGVLNYKEY